MSTLRGLIAGGLGLAALQALVSSDTAAANAGGLVTLGTGALRRLVDPAVPLIPDRRHVITEHGGTVRTLAN